jgi:hypothetical protein
MPRRMFMLGNSMTDGIGYTASHNSSPANGGPCVVRRQTGPGYLHAHNYYFLRGHRQRIPASTRSGPA